jgi:hypothetical protein
MRTLIWPGIFLVLSALLNASESFLHVRLVWTENPQNKATIIWDTESETKSDHALIWEVGAEPLKMEATAAKEYTNIDEEKKGFMGPWFYRYIQLEGLKPSTKYNVQLHCDGNESRTYYFVTAPEKDIPFKLLYVGDSRTRVDVAATISKQLGEMAAKDSSIIAAIHGGDFANKPYLYYWKPWLEAWDLTTYEDGKLLPIIPVVGNHENPKKSPLFGKMYGLEPDDLYLYSCKLAPNFRIVVLNSEIPATGKQEQFLNTTLEQYQKENVQWRLAAFHRPVYPAVKKPSNIKHLVPVFERY